MDETPASVWTWLPIARISWSAAPPEPAPEKGKEMFGSLMKSLPSLDRFCW